MKDILFIYKTHLYNKYIYLYNMYIVYNIYIYKSVSIYIQASKRTRVRGYQNIEASESTYINGRI